MMLFEDSGPTTTLGLNGVTKTVTPHLCSIGPNVQRHMAYFACCTHTLSLSDDTTHVLGGAQREPLETLKDRKASQNLNAPGWGRCFEIQ